MQCRSCGTEIADKAIVCYRCGASTTDPVRGPAPLTRRRSPLLSLVVAAVLLLLALYMGQASRTAADPERWQVLAGLLAGVAVVIAFLRISAAVDVKPSEPVEPKEPIEPTEPWRTELVFP